MTDKLLNWIRPEIRALNAYHVADARGLTKLDAMENPYTLDELTGHWPEVLAAAEINRYPDPSAAVLREKLSQTMDVPEGAATVLGNGSDELIQMLAMVVSGKDRCIMSFDPGFVMYRMIAEFVGMDYVGVPLDESFNLDMVATRAAIEKHQPAIIFIAYPNNPTANLFNEANIEEILKIAPGLVVVDEAYHPFAQSSFMSRLPEYEQLLVMRTVSKMGLAGLRLGMLAGAPELIQEVDKVRLPYNINVLTQQAACSALEYVSVLDEQAALIRAERETMLKALSDMSAVEAFPSRANFILFRLLQHDAASVFASIRDQGVLIKNMNAQTGALKNCLRVTVGKPEENAAFLLALEKALAA
ncbi:MAG: histidinol-phosphate transaminase [Gammaproteobacteria bacterium]|nr:histidinol-phosphate transaminase [Gammaproteobacteria bacterium]MCK5262057.1 histidinol-phosphate transaminase [Gammaproteobacteria bacterium]